MARNGAGTFAILNPILVGALRSSSAVNANFEDAGDEITNSLPLNGEAGMTGQFGAFDGGALAPGIAFKDDLNTGFRRSGNNAMKWVVGGVDRATMDAQGKLTLAGGLAVTGDFEAGAGSFSPQTWVSSASATPAVVLRRTEDDTTERELVQYMSGSGAGAKGSLRQVGGGANDVATLRYYVNDVLAFQWTGTLFSHSLDVAYGASGIEADADGFFDFPELSAAPSAPATNVARAYARDDGGVTRLYYKDGSGNEVPFQSLVDRQTFTASDTWTKPTDGQTMALVELWAGGGGGGRQSGGGGGGGGGGAYSYRITALASLSASVAVTVGSGGAGRGTSGIGGTGGTTSFGSYLSAFGGGGGDIALGGGSSDNGGSGGGPTSAGTNSGDGGEPQGRLGAALWGDEGNCSPFGGAGYDTATSGESALHGGGGGGGCGDGGSSVDAGGDSVFGGAGGGGTDDDHSVNGFGGESVYGGGGGRGFVSSNGETGTAPGGGGGGSSNNTSGAGARGEVRITCW